MPHGPHRMICLIAAFCCPAAAYAATVDASSPDAVTHGPWTGSAAFGGVATSGNSKTSSVDAKLKLGYANGPWIDTARLETLHASDAGVTTANRTFGELDSKYALNPSAYLFANLRGSHDQFSGYRYQTSASFGIGRRLLHTEHMDISAEAGPGYRQARSIGGQTEKDAIARLHGKFAYRFTDKSHFDQTFTAIAGRSNTELDAVSSLTTAITGALALKLSYTVLRNTQVPVGLKKTDTFTSVNLVYSFD